MHFILHAKRIIYIEDWKAQQQNKACSTLRSMESMENDHETLNYHGFGTKKP